MQPSPQACLPASKSYAKIIQFSPKDWSKISKNRCWKQVDFVVNVLIVFVVDFTEFWSKLDLTLGVKIDSKSFENRFGRPRTSKMPPWSLRKDSKTPKVALRSLQKVSKAGHNGLWEGAWTNAHGLVKLRDSIKLEPPKSCMMWTNWMNRLHGI